MHEGVLYFPFFSNNSKLVTNVILQFRKNFTAWKRGTQSLGTGDPGDPWDPEDPGNPGDPGDLGDPGDPVSTFLIITKMIN